MAANQLILYLQLFEVVGMMRMLNHLSAEALISSPGAVGRDVVDTSNEELNMKDHGDRNMETEERNDSPNVQNKGTSQEISDESNENDDGDNSTQQYWSVYAIKRWVREWFKRHPMKAWSIARDSFLRRFNSAEYSGP